jgi:alpha-ketoglutarate-dependent taurine dioxygenase
LTESVFRDQDLSPQQQQALGVYLGDGEIERHPQAAQVPGLGGGVSLIWEQGRRDKIFTKRSWRVPYGGGQFGWHTDLVHEGESDTPRIARHELISLPAFPPGYTHLHQDTVPEVGGDTLWASGYAAYDKLSPTFKKLLDGLK